MTLLDHHSKSRYPENVGTSGRSLRVTVQRQSRSLVIHIPSSMLFTDTEAPPIPVVSRYATFLGRSARCKHLVLALGAITQVVETASINVASGIAAHTQFG